MDYLIKKTSGGFTLIELLVVIAVIGILASVVLSSLNSARSKGGDAAVKSNLATVRTQAELYFSHYGSYRSATGGGYAGNCLTSGTMFRQTSGDAEGMALADTITTAIAAAVSAGTGGKQCSITGSGDQYVVAVQLKSSAAYWCIDNTGVAKEVVSVPIAGVYTCS